MTALRDLQSRITPGWLELPPAMCDGVRARVGDLIAALDIAARALDDHDPGGLAVASEQLALCHWLTGIAWRTYLSDSAQSAEAMRQVHDACRADAAPTILELARRLGERAAAPDRCAACGAAAAIRCATCAYGYCRTHHAREEEWSGSWLTGTYATCPLGHVQSTD